MRSTEQARPNVAATDRVRSFLVGVCIGIASLAFVGFVIIRWAEQHVLSVDGWVNYASHIPQNSDVSWAVADTMVRQIFAGVPIEQTIADVLPPRAGFLASPLSDQLQTRSVQAAQKLVQSDAFQSIWVGANRLAMERFLSNARSGKSLEPLGGNERFTIDLASARPLLREQLASQATIAPALQEKSQQIIAIRTDLRQRRERLWQAVQTTDSLYAVMPVAFLAGFLATLVFAASPRRAAMITAATTLILLLATLITIKYFHDQLTDQVQNLAYVPAIGFLYDSLVDSLRTAVLLGLALWAFVLIICLVLGPAKWAVRLRNALHVPALAKSQLAAWWQDKRLYIARYHQVFWAGLAGLVLLYLAFFAHINTVVLVNSLLATLCGIFLIEILSRSAHLSVAKGRRSQNL